MAQGDREVIPQAVLSPLTRAAIFLVVTIDPGGELVARDLLAGLGDLVKAVAFRVPGGELSCVSGIGSHAWNRLFTGPRPAELHPFRELAGPIHHAPSSPGDLLFHIRAQRMDLCFSLASLLMDRMRSSVTVRDEVHGFKFFDVRDLLGFVDGTANPVGPKARAAVLIGAEDMDFTGGSYVIVQKYLHRQRAWDALRIEDQERVIGRTKLEDVELDDAVKPADSHVARSTIVDSDGTQREILRDNMPFGTVGGFELGTYFIGYARTPSVIERMLDRMFLGDEEASHDRMLDFVTAMTGSLFFVPSAGFLEDLPDPPTALVAAEAQVPAAAGAYPAQPAAPGAEAGAGARGGDVGNAGPAAAPHTTPSSEGSLGIGDLKGTAR
ncbi:MAG: Dyp-type peroxidase [Actinobacteria bacterium]|nr:Dyp-type peroxidase [Actinomycetota bacterium]